MVAVSGRKKYSFPVSGHVVDTGDRPQVASRPGAHEYNGSERRGADCLIAALIAALITLALLLLHFGVMRVFYGVVWVVAFGLISGIFLVAIDFPRAERTVAPAPQSAAAAKDPPRPSPGADRSPSGWIRLGAVIAMVAIAWWIALALPAVLAYVLPAVVVLTCGCVLGGRIARGPILGLWADVLFIAAIVIGLTALTRPGIVTDDPFAAPLFPLAAWVIIRVWRSMRDSRAPTTRASADVLAALLLGATLDLAVVWVGNLAGLHALTVIRASHVLDMIAAGTNPAWWYVAPPFLLLAAGYVALDRWEDRLARTAARVKRSPVARWIRNLPGTRMLRPGRAVAALGLSRRLMSFLHVSLLLVPLVGMTAPGLLGHAVLAPLRARYAIAYRANAGARAEAAAYQELAREVAAASPGQRKAIRGNVEKMIGTSDPGSPGAAAMPLTTIRASAHYLGEKEGEYLEYTDQVGTSHQPSPPPLPTGSVTAGATEADAEETDADEAETNASRAGAAAAAGIGAMIQILGGNVDVQAVQEYLSGLVEEGPVADALGRFAGRLGNTGEDIGDPEEILNPSDAENAAAAGEISPPGSGSGSSVDPGDDPGGGDGGGDGGGGSGGSGDGGGDG
jgi:uncharacterized membrane protein YgcG